jgi:hypothetical protein
MNPNNFSSEISDLIMNRTTELSSDISEQEIAHRLGYASAGIVTMFKTGEVKVPLDKIPALAKALRVDVDHLMTLGLAQFLPKSIRCRVTLEFDPNAAWRDDGIS